jgi:hypothetical protein
VEKPFPIPATIGILIVERLWNWPLETITSWATRLFNPSTLVQDCIQQNGVSGWRHVIGSYWSFPIAFSIALDAVLVLSAYGVDLKVQPPALLLYLVWASLKWLIAVAAIYIALKLLRFSSNFGIIVACYTIVVNAAPLFSLLESPATYHQLELLSAIKAQHLSFIDSVRFLFGHANELKQTEFQSRLIQSCLQIEGALFLILNIFVAESLTSYLLINRFKAYLALWFSSFVSFVPSGALAVFWDAIVYQYIPS